MPTITLPRYKVRILFAAIGACDGAPGGKPYEFDPPVLYALAWTREAVRAEVVAFEAGLRGAENKPDAEVQAFVNEPVSVEVRTVPVAALKLDTNRLPPTVLSDLLPMLAGEL